MCGFVRFLEQHDVRVAGGVVYAGVELDFLTAGKRVADGVFAHPVA